jgi:hypothetical protein
LNSAKGIYDETINSVRDGNMTLAELVYLYSMAKTNCAQIQSKEREDATVFEAGFALGLLGLMLSRVSGLSALSHDDM